MFRDFEKAPSKSSYQLKFILAGLAALALLFSLYSYRSLKGQLFSSSQTTSELTEELKSRDAQLEMANSQLQNTVSDLEASDSELQNTVSLLEALEQKSEEADSQILALSSSQSDVTAELDAASARVAELTTQIAAREAAITAVGEDKIKFQEQYDAVILELEAMTAERDALAAELQ